MNGSLRKVAAFVALMFGALLLNFTHFSVFRTAPLLEHPRNVRVRDAEFYPYENKYTIRTFSSGAY